MSKSRYHRVNKRDVLYGFLYSIATSVLMSVYESIDAKTFPPSDWSSILYSGVGVGILFLLGKMKTNSEGKIFRKEPKPKVIPGMYQQLHDAVTKPDVKREE